MNTSNGITNSKKKRLQMLLFLTIVLIVSSITIGGCGGKQTVPQDPSASDQEDDNSTSQKPNVIEPDADSAITSPDDVDIKIYKDKGDAVAAYYTAIENNKPIFLYFYTDV